MNRPFVGAGIAFATGIAIGCMGSPCLSVIPALVPIIAALTLLAVTTGKWWRAAALALLIMGGARHYQAWKVESIPANLLDIISSKPGLHQARGVISSDPSLLPLSDFYDKKITHRSVFILDVKEVRKGRRWLQSWGKVRVTLKMRKRIELSYGDYVQLEGKFYCPSPPTNPGQFDYRWYLERRSIYLGCSVWSEKFITVISSHAGNRFIEMVYRLRSRLKEKVEMGMPNSDASRLLVAILLGYREEISDRLEQYFRRTNTVHILAISGLHVGLIYLLIRCFLRIFALPKVAVSLVAIPLLLIYMVLTGMKVPVLRATLMIVVYLMAPLFRRQADLYNTVGFAAFIILLFAPAQLFDAGFQLSFVAVISIILFTPAIERALLKITRLDVLPGQLYRGPLGGWPAKAGRLIIVSLAVSLAVMIGLAPLIAYYFNIISPITVVANIAVAFLLTAVIAMGFLSAALGFVWNDLALCLNRVNFWCLDGLIGWVKLMAKIPFAYFYVRTPSPLEIGGYYAVVFVLVIRKFFSPKGLLVGLTALCVGIIVLLPAGECGRKTLDIYFLDVGQGDSAFIRLPNGATILVDGGPKTNFDSGKFIVLPFLRTLGVRVIDVVVATHADMDHIGGLISIIDEMKIEKVIMSHTRHATWTKERFLDLLKEQGQVLHMGRRGEQIVLCPEVMVDIIHPTARWVRSGEVSENDRSIVIRVVYGNTSAILTGDIGTAVEEEIIRKVSTIRSDVLKVAHHGAGSGTTKDFLWAVRPRLAIISAGRNNSFGHPDPEVMDRLISMGASIYRTDRDGAVVLRSDGRSWECAPFCSDFLRDIPIHLAGK